MLSIIELEKIGIKEISRIHSKSDKNLIEKVFMKMKESYQYTSNKLDLKKNQMIKGKFIIYYFEEKQKTYCIEYRDNKILEIIFRNEQSDKYEEIKVIQINLEHLKISQELNARYIILLDY